MKISVPADCLIVVADGAHAKLFRNTATSGISLKADGVLSTDLTDGHGASRLPTDSSPKERDEANVAKHIADSLYERTHKGEFKSVVLIADPQTLGQIRPHLHQEVKKIITGELAKTLTNSSVSDIEKTLTSAVSA